jgi:hypothetical protein
VKRGVITVLAAAAATAAFWPAAGNAATVKGIVVARERGVLLVASPTGSLQAVRAHAAVGARLAGTTVVGRAGHARVRGIVVRRLGRTLILSSNRHLIAIPNRVGRALAATSTPVSPGSVVTTEVEIRNGRLELEDEDEIGEVADATITIQATVKAVAAGSVTLDVQGQSITLELPAGLTLPASLVGQTVTLSVRLDDDDQADDDRGDDDHGGDHHGGGDHGGRGHGGDDD